MPNTLIYIFTFIFGSMVGSFLNVCIHRIPEGKSIVFPPSSCPHCNNPIAFYDNIPIISYIMLLGRCRQCKSLISPRYPFVEFLTGFFSVILLKTFGFSIELPVYFIFAASLLVITFIDLKYQIIPDVISLPGIIVGFLVSYFLPHGMLNSIIGILAGGGSLFLVAFGYQLITGREGMGGGDIKLLAMIGAFLGWKAVIITIFTGSFIGAVVGSALMLAKGKDTKYAIPFGPFLVIGALIALFCGKTLMKWFRIPALLLGSSLRRMLKIRLTPHLRRALVCFVLTLCMRNYLCRCV
ncbi:MAG: prepilin peptidase [Deltaproteobacteria bacterium]|nr:prepilin peptidase [Deltaproteobacteria bacterium]